MLLSPCLPLACLLAVVCIPVYIVQGFLMGLMGKHRHHSPHHRHKPSPYDDQDDFYHL